MRLSTKRLVCGACGRVIESGQFCGPSCAQAAPSPVREGLTKEALLKRLESSPWVPGKAALANEYVPIRRLWEAVISHPFDNLAGFSVPPVLVPCLRTWAPEIAPVSETAAPTPKRPSGATYSGHPFYYPHRPMSLDAMRAGSMRDLSLALVRAQRTRDEVNLVAIKDEITRRQTTCGHTNRVTHKARRDGVRIVKRGDQYEMCTDCRKVVTVNGVAR